LSRTNNYKVTVVQVQLTANQIGIRFETNSDQHALNGHLKRLDGLRAFDLNCFHMIAADDATHDRFRKCSDAVIGV